MRAIIKKGIAKKKTLVNNTNVRRLISMNERLYHNLTQHQEEYLDFE